MRTPPRQSPFAKAPLRSIAGAALAFALTEALTLYAMAVSIGGGSAVGAVQHGTPISLAELLFSFAVATVALLVLLRTVKSGLVYTVMFGAAIAIGAWNWFDVFLPAGTAFLLAASLASIALGLKRVWTTDLMIVLGVAGVAISFAAVTEAATVLAFLVILSFYDIIAVYRTRHMVGMARSLMDRGAVFALLVPSRTGGLAARIEDASKDKGFFVLGTGDLAIPTAFVAVAARTSFPAAVSAAAGSLAGFLLLAAIFAGQREPRPMAALPPIATGTIIGYLIGLAFL